MTLTCPTGANMAAIAKQLHKTAVETENEIFVLEQRMRAAVNTPTVMLTSTALLTGITSGAPFDAGSFATWATTFDNTAGGSGSGSGAFGPQNFGFFTAFLGEGLYEVGWCATVVASGAVTDNSTRRFEIQHRRPDPTVAGGETQLQIAGETLFESNTGVGVETSFTGLFRAAPNDRFAFLITHNNATTLNMNVGAIIWANKLSEVNLTRVL